MHMHGQANETRSTRGDSQLMQVVQGRVSRRKEKVQDLRGKETSRQAPAWFKGKPPVRRHQMSVMALTLLFRRRGYNFAAAAGWLVAIFGRIKDGSETR